MMKPYRLLVVDRFNRFSTTACLEHGITQDHLPIDMAGAVRQLEGAAVTRDAIIVFDGGHDVTPALYGERNRFGATDLARDIRDTFIYRTARALGLPIFGFCRGHQFVAVMEGGTLIQDIAHDLGIYHGGQHDVLVTDDHFTEMFHDSPFGVNRVSSTHHQCVGLVPPTGTVIATDTTGRICEGIVYPSFGLTLQCHPEHGDWFAPLDWVAATFL